MSLVTVSPVTHQISHYTFIQNRSTISFTNIANALSCTSI